MSKITFRADDDLVQRLEEFDASKSEVMREALRQYLDGADRQGPPTSDGSSEGSPESLEELVANRVDDVVRERLDGLVRNEEPRDVNVNIALDGDGKASAGGSASARIDDATGENSGPAGRKTIDDGDGGDEEERPCAKCGESITASHVYCPNCGEKASRRVFCECGDELRSDWSFCPGCGRRTAAADVLEQS